MRMKVIYIAGRYRDPRGEFYVEANRREAAGAIAEVALARELGLPILHTQVDVFKYLESEDK